MNFPKSILLYIYREFFRDLKNQLTIVAPVLHVQLVCLSSSLFSFHLFVLKHQLGRLEIKWNIYEKNT